MSKIEEVRIISPKDIVAKAPRRNEIAFPDIPFKDEPLWKKRTTLKAAYTNINKYEDAVKYLSDLSDEWKKKGDIEWQNEMLNKIEKDIRLFIDDFDDNIEDLKKIFIYIQLWGGSNGRGFFDGKGGNFESKFDKRIYRDAINAVKVDATKEENIRKGLCSLLALNQIAMSFATKHIYFWSKKELPIFDNIISNIVFGRKIRCHNINDYLKYVAASKKVSDLKGVDSHQIERSLFNWANTEDGKRWVDLRMPK